MSRSLRLPEVAVARHFIANRQKERQQLFLAGVINYRGLLFVHTITVEQRGAVAKTRQAAVHVVTARDDAAPTSADQRPGRAGD
eukprot:2269790-Pleurochrysis_carterae.AAC.1